MLLFFDVQPITVKAYGGRRYTSAKRLVLERRQKIRAKFYLFALYEVNDQIVRWAFFDAKDSDYVCQFMHLVRQWYPEQQVWIGLDQDRAHPCKCLKTRQLMRKLKLHYISLPKGSPDDNPVEIIFSDIELMILDNSNDPDAQTTQRRISARLRGRNLRHDRGITIHYIPDTHKS